MSLKNCISKVIFNLDRQTEVCYLVYLYLRQSRFFILVRKLLTTIVILLSVSHFTFGQDVSFSQFYANRLYLNPAFAGTANCPRFAMNYRNQWPGIDNSFITYAASYDKMTPKLNGGIGFQLLSDRAGEGVLNTFQANFMYSYQFSVNRDFSVRAGFQASFIQKSIDVSSLRFGDMIDPRRGFVYQSQEQILDDKVTYPDFSFGMIGFSHKLYFGAAIHHLTAPDEGFTQLSVLPRKLTAHFGGLFDFGIRNDDMKWSPNVIYQVQEQFMELNVGMYISKGPIELGLWHRLNDSYIAMIGIQKKHLKIGYSYDMTSSLLSDKTNGSHEISYAYVFPCKPKKIRFQTISCPSF